MTINPELIFNFPRAESSHVARTVAMATDKLFRGVHLDTNCTRLPKSVRKKALRSSLCLRPACIKFAIRQSFWGPAHRGSDEIVTTRSLW